MTCWKASLAGSSSAATDRVNPPRERPGQTWSARGYAAGMGAPQPGDMRRIAAVGDRPAGDVTVGLRRSRGHLVSAVVPIAAPWTPTSQSRVLEQLGGRSRPNVVRGQVLRRHGVADEPDAFLVVALDDRPEAETEPAVGLAETPPR
jgi:hypothetical protein